MIQDLVSRAPTTLLVGLTICGSDGILCSCNPQLALADYTTMPANHVHSSNCLSCGENPNDEMLSFLPIWMVIPADHTVPANHAKRLQNTCTHQNWLFCGKSPNNATLFFLPIWMVIPADHIISASHAGKLQWWSQAPMTLLRICNLSGRLP